MEMENTYVRFRHQILSSAPVVLQAPLSSTATAVSRLANGHQDIYEPSTQQERAYLHGISLIYFQI
jgi:MinD-like ATPase involved in chromosome partitioning or flagellar assembly